MSVYIVDASVAVKWFLSEIHSEAALRLLAPVHNLVAPDFLWLEVCSVACQRIRRKQILPEEGLQILPALRRFRMQVYPWTDFLDRATAIAMETTTSVYDCLYVALALSRRARLVTADFKFYRILHASQYRNSLLWVEDIP